MNLPVQCKTCSWLRLIGALDKPGVRPELVAEFKSVMVRLLNDTVAMHTAAGGGADYLINLTVAVPGESTSIAWCYMRHASLGRLHVR